MIRHCRIPIKRLSAPTTPKNNKGNILNVVAIDHIIVQRTSRLSSHKCIDTLDVIDDLLDVGRESEDEGDEGKCTDGIEGDEDNSTLIEDHIVALDIDMRVLKDVNE